MIKKYFIVLTCITCIALILGVTANLSYEDFNNVADYFSSDKSFVLAESMLVKKVLTWISVYSFEYDVSLSITDSGGLDYVDYIFIPPEESPNGNGSLTLIIDDYDKSLGIDGDLRRLGNMLSHDSIPAAPTNPGITDFPQLTWIGVRSLVEGVRYFSGILYSIISILLHSLPMLLDILMVFLYLIGLSPSLV